MANLGSMPLPDYLAGCGKKMICTAERQNVPQGLKVE